MDKKLKLKNMTAGQIVLYMSFCVFNCLVTLSTLYILFFGITQACKTHEEAQMFPFALPEVWHFEHYIEAFTMLNVRNVNLWGMMGNSLWYALGTTILGIMGNFCVTYIISKYTFPGSKLLNIIAIFVIMVPLYGSSSATYRLIYTWKLNDSPLILLTSIGSLGGSYLVMKAFIDGVSWTYAEAALIDGASDFRVMWQIMFPQLISPMMAIFVTSIVTNWSAFSFPLLYLSNMPTISVGLYLFKQDMVYKVREDILYAASLLAIIPVWIIYGILNKSLLNLTFGGGIKG